VKETVAQAEFDPRGSSAALYWRCRRVADQIGCSLFAMGGNQKAQRILLALAFFASVSVVLAISTFGFRVGVMIAASTVASDKSELDGTAVELSGGLPLPTPRSTKFVAPDNLNFTPRRDPPGRSHYIYLVRAEARTTALPAEIADVVAYVESGYDPVRIGNAGEIGLMQVRPSTARMLGFRGSAAELFNPAKNVHYGVLYLAQAWRLAKGDLCRALMKYRAGHGTENMTLKSTDYCSRAKAYLASQRGMAASARRAVRIPVPVPRPSNLSASKSKVGTRKTDASQHLQEKHQSQIHARNEGVHAKAHRASHGRPLTI
jgi:hypothetical protein